MLVPLSVERVCHSLYFPGIPCPSCRSSAYRFKLFRMKRSLAVSIALLLCLSTGFAQDWAKQKLDKSPRHGEWVQIKHDNRTVQAFVVYPETKAKAPVVIVIHEIYGLTDWARSVADQLATNRKDLSAAFVFYGQGPADVSAITAPVYGFYAGEDARIGATLPDTQAAMKAGGKKYDPVTYEGAGHGYMRAGEDPAADAAIKATGDDEK